MGFPLTPRSLTLDDLELHKFEFLVNFTGFRTFRMQQQAKRMKIGQYRQRQRCKHVELEQFLADFHVARVCQRYLGFLVVKNDDNDKSSSNSSVLSQSPTNTKFTLIIECSGNCGTREHEAVPCLMHRRICSCGSVGLDNTENGL